MKLLLSILMILGTVSAYAQATEKIDHLNIDDTKLALEGYDPVAYVNQLKALKGKPSIFATVNGVRYQFSSQENRAIFLGSPGHFTPQYGGWCAYAMGAKGEKVDVDPETFKIIDGKLYLFYNRFFNNTLETWNKNESDLKAKADMNWNKITKR